jgi:hypothetical protein
MEEAEVEGEDVYKADENEAHDIAADSRSSGQHEDDEVCESENEEEDNYKTTTDNSEANSNLLSQAQVYAYADSDADAQVVAPSPDYNFPRVRRGTGLYLYSVYVSFTHPLHGQTVSVQAYSTPSNTTTSESYCENEVQCVNESEIDSSDNDDIESKSERENDCENRFEWPTVALDNTPARFVRVMRKAEKGFHWTNDRIP